jgi:hypothetical protein
LHVPIGQRTLEECLTTGVIAALAAIEKREQESWNVPEKDNCILPIGWQQDASEIVRVSGDAKTIDAVFSYAQSTPSIK